MVPGQAITTGFFVHFRRLVAEIGAFVCGPSQSPPVLSECSGRQSVAHALCWPRPSSDSCSSGLGDGCGGGSAESPLSPQEARAEEERRMVSERVARELEAFKAQQRQREAQEDERLAHLYRALLEPSQDAGAPPHAVAYHDAGVGAFRANGARAFPPVPSPGVCACVGGGRARYRARCVLGPPARGWGLRPGTCIRRSYESAFLREPLGRL